MSKERLEEIERSWERKSDDYNWLIEKARLTEEYSEIIVSQNESLTELMEQNKRYREALEEILKPLNQTSYEKEHTYRQIARKALEESE